MFDDQEENQDQPKPSPARLRFSYWLAGLDPDSGMPPRTPPADRTQTWQELQAKAPFSPMQGIGQRMMQPDAASGQAGQRETGMTPSTRPANLAQSRPSLQREPRTAPKLSIGQRLMQMDLDAASGRRTGIASKLTLGQRLMGLDGRGRFRVDNPQAQQGISNRLSPARALPSPFEATNNLWSRDGQAAFARDQQAAPNSPRSGSTAILDMTAHTKARSRIPRPGAVQEVEPNPTLRDPKQQAKGQSKQPTKLTKEQMAPLSGLMRDIRQSKPPRALRYLSPAEEEETAHLARSENTRGTVAEHEAVISVILNRVQSGLDQRRQYLDRGQEANVHNVINATTRHGIHQFQGLDNNEYGRNFAVLHDQGAQNARTAAGNIAARGPTNKATAFIVTETDPHTGRPKKPDERTVSHLGHVHFVGQVEHVFLYAPNTPQARTRPQATAAHHHPASHRRK
jgi:hypothetical protein